MDVSVIGLAGSGKSTLIQAMSGLSGKGLSKSGILSVRVPDSRINKLSKIFNPQKTTYAEFRMKEIPWVRQDSTNRKSSAEKYVKTLAGADLLVHVIGNFDNPYLSDSADPVRDLGAMDSEMLLADLVVCENFFERHKKRPADPNVFAAIKKAEEALEQEKFLVSVDFSKIEFKLLGGFGFATLMKQLIVINQGEDAPSLGISDPHRRVVELPLSFAKEVAELPEDEQMEFLAEMGFKEPLVNRISQEAYAMMSYISFFTVGEDEVRAWTITDLTPAVNAAGKIHTDLERGFIRAEVVNYETFIKKGTLKACRDEGLLKAEGKTYIVKDGDIINVRFNV